MTSSLTTLKFRFAIKLFDFCDFIIIIFFSLFLYSFFFFSIRLAFGRCNSSVTRFWAIAFVQTLILFENKFTLPAIFCIIFPAIPSLLVWKHFRWRGFTFYSKFQVIKPKLTLVRILRCCFASFIHLLPNSSRFTLNSYFHYLFRFLLFPSFSVSFCKCFFRSKSIFTVAMSCLDWKKAIVCKLSFIHSFIFFCISMWTSLWLFKQKNGLSTFRNPDRTDNSSRIFFSCPRLSLDRMGACWLWNFSHNHFSSFEHSRQSLIYLFSLGFVRFLLHETLFESVSRLWLFFGVENNIRPSLPISTFEFFEPSFRSFVSNHSFWFDSFLESTQIFSNAHTLILIRALTARCPVVPSAHNSFQFPALKLEKLFFFVRFFLSIHRATSLFLFHFRFQMLLCVLFFLFDRFPPSFNAVS